MVSVSRESQNCQVLFRGRGAPVPVALRHLKVTSSATRLLESPITNESELDDGRRGYAEASGWRDQSLDFSLLQEPSQAPPPPLPRTGQERSWPGLGQQESRPEFPFREPVVEPLSGNLTELQKRDVRIQSLEAQLTELERAHAAEVRSLRSALEECVRAIENCAQTIDSACAGGLMGPMPNQPSTWANGGPVPSGQASGWQSAAKALHDAAELGLNALGLDQVSAPRTPAAAPAPPQYMMVYEPFPPVQSVVTTPSISRRPSITISRQPSVPLGSAPVGLSRSFQALPVMPQVLVQTARGSQALFMQPLGGVQPAPPQPAATQQPSQPMQLMPQQPPSMFGPPAAALGQGQAQSGASPFLQLPPQPLPSPQSASLSAGPGPPAGPGAFSFGAALQGGLPAFQPGAQTPGLPGLPPFRLSLRPPGNILAGLSGVAPPFGMAGFTASQAQSPPPFAAAPGAGPWSPTPSLDPGSGAKAPPGVVQDGKLDWSRAH